jgi:3',5'-nucleoside bisphosphate phosphatase
MWAMNAPAPAYPHDINVDLHMHSTASDGALAPEAVVARAAQNGVQILALTDHDTVGGQHAAQETARSLGLAYVTGVEISVTWGGETIHVVGLNFDLTHPGLRDTLAGIQHGRMARARAMADGLMAHGLPDIFDDAMSYAGNPELIGRTHFARAMVARGLCSDMNQVFQKYLTPGKPGYFAHEWTSLSRAVGAIRAAGGVAVLAHPARYRLSAIGHWALIDEFKTLGGTAVEVVTGSHSDQEARRFQRVAIEQGLHASRGSDFHAVGESRFDVGAVPPLPDATRPVWHGWPH